MLRQELVQFLDQLFQQKLFVLGDSDDYWAGIGVCGAYQVFMLVPRSGEPPWEIMRGAAPQCDLAVLVVSGDIDGTMQAPHLDIPLVAVIDGEVSARAATSLRHADIVVATQKAPKPLREAADLMCDDIHEGAALIARFTKTIQPASVRPTPAAQNNILEIVPADVEQPFDVHALLDTLCAKSFVALKGAGALVLGAGQVNGNPVMILASQPAIDGGRIGVEDCYAAVRLIGLAQRLRLPVLVIQDTAGMTSEDGLPEAVEKLLKAWATLDMPVVTLVAGRACGLAHVALAGAGTRPTALIAWPRAWISLDNPQAGDKRASVMTAAKGFGVNEVIDPRVTSDTISGWLTLWRD